MVQKAREGEREEDMDDIQVADEDKRTAMITACSLAWEFEPHALEHDISSITSSHTHNF